MLKLKRSNKHTTKETPQMNALLKQISEAACSDLAKLIEEGNEDILSAIHKAEEEAQLQETAPKFSLGYKITVDLDKSTFDCQLGWSFKQTLSVSHQIEDENQPKLPIDGTAPKSFKAKADAFIMQAVVEKGGRVVFNKKL